jgi:hypothetical protein
MAAVPESPACRPAFASEDTKRRYSRDRINQVHRVRVPKREHEGGSTAAYEAAKREFFHENFRL